MLANPADWLIWSDASILVINKPAGLPTLVDGYNPQAPYLAGLLNDAFGPVWVVHRLDRDTSGVILFARNAGAHRDLNTQFANRATRKIYHALVTGSPGWDDRHLSLALKTDGDRQHRTVVDHRRGKPASTEFHVLKRFSNITLLEAIPHTGRTHQIRAHLASLGYPVVADLLYGGQTWINQKETGEPLIERSALHAWSLDFLHPATGAAVHFSAPYPNDFIQTLAWLEHQES